MTKRHREAHEALMDWADWWLHFSLHSNYAQGNFRDMIELGRLIQRPAEVKLPEIRYSNHRVIAINWWWEETADTLRARAYNEYLAERTKKKPLTKKQKELLLDDVSKYLTGKG